MINSSLKHLFALSGLWFDQSEDEDAGSQSEHQPEDEDAKEKE